MNPIIFTERTDTGIEVTVRKGVDGQDILHTALILFKMIFGGATGMEPVTDVDAAFDSIKALYLDEYCDSDSEKERVEE